MVEKLFHAKENFRNREMFPHLTNFSLVFFLFDLSMRHMDKNIRQSSFTLA